MTSLMELLEVIRPEARTIYLLKTEYTLHRLQHPDTPQRPADPHCTLSTAPRQSRRAANLSTWDDFESRQPHRDLQKPRSSRCYFLLVDAIGPQNRPPWTQRTHLNTQSLTSMRRTLMMFEII